jgi:Protein of unknown function (DUF3237)
MAPDLTFVFELRAQVEPPIEFGEVSPGRRRRMVPISSGRFDGPSLRGRIVPGGADWQIVHGDGFTELDSRYALETDEGHLITVRNAGIRRAAPAVMARLLAGEAVDPAQVYFRTMPRFETAAPSLQWLTRSIFVGFGERYPAEVVVRFWLVE